MEYLEKEDVILINHSTVKNHGGNFVPPSNFLHEENLDYLLEAVQSEMFGEQIYPEIWDKAAVYCYNIICNHIFSDGNKRTGLGVAIIFLHLNHFRINKNLRKKEVENFIISVASGQVSLEECKNWFKENIVPLV